MWTSLYEQCSLPLNAVVTNRLFRTCCRSHPKPGHRRWREGLAGGRTTEACGRPRRSRALMRAVHGTAPVVTSGAWLTTCDPAHPPAPPPPPTAQAVEGRGGIGFEVGCINPGGWHRVYGRRLCGEARQGDLFTPYLPAPCSHPVCATHRVCGRRLCGEARQGDQVWRVCGRTCGSAPSAPPETRPILPGPRCISLPLSFPSQVTRELVLMLLCISKPSPPQAHHPVVVAGHF
jgi:hypothetical protein